MFKPREAQLSVAMNRCFSVLSPSLMQRILNWQMRNRGSPSCHISVLRSHVIAQRNLGCYADALQGLIVYIFILANLPNQVSPSYISCEFYHSVFYRVILEVRCRENYHKRKLCQQTEWPVMLKLKIYSID